MQVVGMLQLLCCVGHLKTCAVPCSAVPCCVLLCFSVLLCCAGVYSVGPADQKQLLSCAELANRRHAELTEQLQLQQQAGRDMEQ